MFASARAHRRTSVIGLAAACVLVGGLTACGSSTGTSAAPKGTATATAAAPKKLALAVDAKGAITGMGATLAAGTYAITATAAATTSYSVEMARLAPGYTRAQVEQDIAKGLDAQDKPDLAAVTRFYTKTTLVGGPAGTGTQTATVFVPAGDYLYVNSDLEGTPTYGSFTATAGDTTPAIPAGAVTVTASGDMKGAFTFAVTGSLGGTGTLSYVNKSEDNPHFLIVAKLKAGKTGEDCQNYEGDPSAAASPCTFVASTAVISPGASLTTTYAGKGAGNYWLACFLPDPKTGTPHALEGMSKTVTVS